MKHRTESFTVYSLVIIFAGIGFMPLISFAGGAASLLTVLAVSPLSFYAASQLYIFEERRERARRRRAMKLHLPRPAANGGSNGNEPLRAA